MECECSEEEEQALQMLAMGALPNPPPAGHEGLVLGAEAVELAEVEAVEVARRDR